MSKVYTINTGNKAQFLSEYALLSGSRITGSLFGTASWAQSSSVATSASFASIGPGTTNRIALFNSTNTISSSLIAQSGDSIGIGTTSPDQLLTITAPFSSSPTGNIRFVKSGTNTVGGGSYIQFDTSLVATAQGDFNARIEGIRSSDSNGSSELRFYTTKVAVSNTAAERLRITAEGNVGIGTTSPTVALQVSRTDSGIIVNAGGSAVTGSGIKFRNDGYEHWTAGVVGTAFSVATSGDNGDRIWGNSPTRRLTITSTGLVGVGTTSPDANFTVDGQSSFNSGSVTNPGIAARGDLNTGIYFPTLDTIGFVEGGSEAMRIDSSGRVGVGTTSPSASFHVQGSGMVGGDGTTSYDLRLQRLSSGIRAITHNAVFVNNSPWYLHGMNLVWTGERAGTVDATHAHRPYYEAFSPASGYKEFGFINLTTGNFTTTNLIPNIVLKNDGTVGIGTTNPSNTLQIQGNVSASSYTSSINNAVGFFGTASVAVSSSRTDSASRADSSATIDVLSGGSTTGLGIYSGSFFGTSSWAVTASNAITASYALNAGGATAGFPFSGSAVITGSLLISSSGLTLTGVGLTGSVFGTSSWANTASVVTTNTVSYTAGAGLSGGGTATLGGSSVTIDAVAGAGISLTAPTNDAININTGSTHFLDGVKQELNTEGVFSSSAQVNHNTTTNYVANQHIDHTSVSISAGDGLTGGGTIAASRTLTVRYVPSLDNRAVNNPPASSSAGLYADFKENTTDGLSDGGTYHGVLTFRPYGTLSDFSGGPAHQLGFTERGGLYLRTGSSNSWGPWGRLAYQTGSILGTASFATSSSFATTASFATTSSFAQTGGAVVNALTFSNTGNGDATGTTYNGSVARTISYNSVGAIQGTQTAYSAITSGSSGDWFPLFSMSEVTNGPVYCSINTYAHSSVSFIAVDGYGPSNLNHIVILGSVWNANNTFANISGVRITDAGVVQIRLTWTTGPTVDIDVALTCAGTPPALSANLSVDNSGTITDSVDLTTLNGYIRTENGYYGGTNLVLNANGASYLNGGNVGIGTTSPSTLLHISASGTTNDFLIGSTGSPKLFVSASGNIGINTLSPAERLRVNGTFASNAIWTTGASLANWGAYSTAYGTLTWDVGYARVHATVGNRLDLGANGSNPHITITGSGDVGIGITSSFSNKLHVQGNVSASSYTSSISNAIGFVGTSSWAVSASRASSSAGVDVLSGGSTSALGTYSGSFSGSFFGNLTGTGGSGTTFPFSGSAVITGSLLISGSGLQVTGSTITSGSILPGGDNMFDLGSSARRWANLYTGDLVLSNEGSKGNTVDGTTGNWTVQEGDTHLYIINNKSGKKYKFVLEEIT